MKKRGIESSAEWAAVASHENAHARGFLEERDAHMSGLATYLGVTGNLGITADDNLVTEMLFGAIMNDNSANEDGVYHWTLMADGSLRMDEDGYLRDENGFYINSDGTRTSKRTDNTIGSKGQETELLKILGLEDTPENRETVRNLLIENRFTHTIDPDDPDNVDEWYWDRTGPITEDGISNVDNKYYNSLRKIDGEDIWSQFNNSIPAAVFAANYEATVDTMIADALIGPIETQEVYSTSFPVFPISGGNPSGLWLSPDPEINEAFIKGAWNGFLNTINPVNWVSGLWNTVVHPVETFNGIIDTVEYIGNTLENGTGLEQAELLGNGLGIYFGGMAIGEAGSAIREEASFLKINIQPITDCFGLVWGDNGVTAGIYANKNGLTTLEMTLKNAPSFLEDPKYWSDISANFARSATGEERALLIPDFSFKYPAFNTFKDIEFDLLLSNNNVESITLIW